MTDESALKGRPGHMNYVVLSGSPRAHSFNTSLARAVAREMQGLGADADVRTIADFAMPLYDQDAQATVGFPSAADDLRAWIESANGLVIASPEFNASMPGVVKNALDWLSRYKPQPFVDRQVLLVSASPSMVGGNRGLWALRVPLEHMGARVYPDMYSLAAAHNAFADDGAIADAAMAGRLRQTLASFMDLAEAATHYGCAKRVWQEFLSDTSAGMPQP